MKLLVIGCVLASAYSANLEGLGSDQYFERTPNNNLVQIKYIAVQGGGLYDNRQLADSQRYGNNNQFSNQLINQVSQDSRFQNQFNNENERFNQQFNQQNQRFNQFSQRFSQENQNFDQQNQLSQFSQQNSGFSGQPEPFSFNNHEFANPNLVEISFDENRHQQFLQNQERQRQGIQSQQRQRQEFQNQQRQRQEIQNQQRQRQDSQRQENQNFNQQNQFSQFSQQNRGFSGQAEQFSFNNHQFANPNLVEISIDENRQQQFLQNQERQRQGVQHQQRQGVQHQQRQGPKLQNQQRQRQDFQTQQKQRQQQFSQRQQQQPQQNQFSNQNQQQHFTQTQTQNRNPFFNNHHGFQQSSRVQSDNFQNNRVIPAPAPERVQSSLVVHGNQIQDQRPSRINHLNNQGFQQSSRVQSNNFQNNRVIPAPAPERVQSSLAVHGNQIQDQRPSRINHFNNQGTQSFQNQFQHGQGFQNSPMREISGHLQRVDSDEILGIFQPFSIPASASLYEGNVNSQFTCSSQGQGFFADPINNCQQFHVCTRVQGRNTPDLYRFTFQCAEGEFFDQAALTCLRRASPNSGSCSASPSMYQSSSSRALQLFNSFSGTPYTPGTTPPGICYLANNAQFVTGIRRK